MTEHLSKECAARYGRRELSAAELISVDDHLAVCETCRAILHEAEAAEELSASLFAGLEAEARGPLAHLNYEKMEAYVDGTLDEAEREIVASHLHICAPCSDEVEDLLSFKASTETDVNSREVATVEPPTGMFAHLRDWFRVPSYRLAFQTAAVLFIAAIALLVLLLPLRKELTDLRAQVDGLKQQNAELRKQGEDTAELRAQLDALRQENEALQLAQPAAETPDRALALKDAGGKVMIDEDGRLQGLTALSAANLQLVSNALKTGRVVTPAAMSEVTMRAGVLMGSSSPGVSFALHSPVGTFVQSPRPTFRWRALPGVTSYIVTVYDAAFRVIAKSEAVTDTQWTPANDLERGATYRWQVTANVNDQQVNSPMPPAPEARFKVIESAAAEDVRRARQSLGDSHLAMGVLYAQAGLLDDAEREFQSLVRANPQSNVARRLLESVRARRR